MEKIAAKDPEARSADVVAENLERLKALLPEAFTEGKVNFETLRQLLGGTVDDREEKYGLNWHGKRQARQLALTPCEVRKGVVPQTYWPWKDVGSTRNAKQELSQIMGPTSGEDLFVTPKPTKLLARMLQIGTDAATADIVLDFFAGSGSTGHAVLKANHKDSGNRRHILVQLTEPTGYPKYPTLAELTKERLRRAASKIKEETPAFAGDLGFRVFKLDTSNIRAWDPTPEDLEGELLASLDHIKSDRSEQDILYELLLKLGLDLCVPIETRTVGGKPVHAVGAGALIVCLGEAIACADAEPLALGIADWRDELAPAGESAIIFRDSAFADDVTKTNLTAILEQRGLANVRSL